MRFTSGRKRDAVYRGRRRCSASATSATRPTTGSPLQVLAVSVRRPPPPSSMPCSASDSTFEAVAIGVMGSASQSSTFRNVSAIISSMRAELASPCSSNEIINLWSSWSAKLQITNCCTGCRKLHAPRGRLLGFCLRGSLAVLPARLSNYVKREVRRLPWPLLCCGQWLVLVGASSLRRCQHHRDISFQQSCHCVQDASLEPRHHIYLTLRAVLACTGSLPQLVYQK